MNDAQLLRYARHIMLNDVGLDGQERLLSSHALIIGAGGLASPIALYLAAAGVGQITIVDDDKVELSNLQRQIMHSMQSTGKLKVESAQMAMKALNPEVVTYPVPQRADAPLLQSLVAKADIVLDACDNFATRHAINAACTAQRKPLVSGAAIGMDGQFTVFDSRQATSPCYACLFPPDKPPQEARCATLGVLGPLVGIIGAMQAAEAVKILAQPDFPSSVIGRLLMLDVKRMQWDEMRIRRQASCFVCHLP